MGFWLGAFNNYVTLNMGGTLKRKRYCSLYENRQNATLALHGGTLYPKIRKISVTQLLNVPYFIKTFSKLSDWVVEQFR